MPLVPNQSFSLPGKSLFVRGSGGGGGGVGNQLTLSTLTFGIGTGSNNNNIQYQTNQLVLAGVGDSNTFNIGYGGSNQVLGDQYSVEMVFDNGAGGDITFGNINGNNSALTAINFQSSGLNSGNISTFIYGTTQILPSGAPSGAGSELLVSSILCSTINGAIPGGGGGAAVSTFTDIQVSSVAGQPGSLYILGNDAGLYNINVSSATGVTALQIGLQGGRQEVYSAVMEAPDFHTSTIKGATGQISLNPSGTEQIRIGGTGAPGDITIASVGGGNINLQGPTNVTSGTFAVPGSGTISSLTTSSINGAAYPPPVPATPPGYYNWLPQQQTIGSGTLPNILNYSTIVSSPVFSTTTGFTLSGSLTCSVTFQGTGNTNPVQNVANNGDASFGLYMIMDGTQYPLTSLSFTTTNNTSPAGQYNSVAPSYNSNANQGAFIVQPNYNFNSPSASPGVEFTYTALGAHTFQLFAWTDLFMASADPTANYATVLRFPRSGDFSGSGILVQYH